MSQSPAIAQASGIALPRLAPVAGWPQRVAGGPPSAAATLRGMGLAPPYPPGGISAPFAAPAVLRTAPAYQTADSGSFSLLDPRSTAAIRLPKEGLLSGFEAGSGWSPWTDDVPPLDLFWRISDDPDDGQQRSRWDRYPEFGDMGKGISDWRSQQVKDVIEHNGRRYQRLVWELINEVATATPETAMSLHQRIDNLLRHDHATRNIFHKYLEDRLSGDTEEDTRSLLLDEASVDLMSARQLRDLAAKILARSIMSREVSSMGLLSEQLPPSTMPSREQVETIVTPETMADLRHALDAYLEIRRQYDLVRAARHQYPAETRRGSLVQMNDLTGEALRELLKFGARAEGRLLEAGINFRAPRGYRYPDGSFGRSGPTPENIEVKSLSGKPVPSQVEKDMWAEKVLGIRWRLMTEPEVIGMARRILGDPEEDQ